MIIHNINPVFLSLGPISIRYYGLVYVIGFLFFYFYLKYIVKKNAIENMDSDKVDTFMIYFIIGGIIGARLLDFIFYNPGILFNDPLEFFRVWHGGMSIHGGVIGAAIAALLFTKKYKVKFYKLADITAIPLMLFLGIGRIANFINGELWGTLSNSALCIDYSKSQYILNPPIGCRYPYQIFASLKNFAVAGIMLIVTGTKKLKDGLLFWYSILLYSIGRFLLDFVREDPRLLGISMGQLLCVIFAIVSIYFIIKIYLDKKTDNVTAVKIKTHSSRHK